MHSLPYETTFYNINFSTEITNLATFNICIKIKKLKYAFTYCKINLHFEVA